jgi:hypothetical protein
MYGVGVSQSVSQSVGRPVGKRAISNQGAVIGLLHFHGASGLSALCISPPDEANRFGNYVDSTNCICGAVSKRKVSLYNEVGMREYEPAKLKDRYLLTYQTTAQVWSLFFLLSSSFSYSYSFLLLVSFINWGYAKVPSGPHVVRLPDSVRSKQSSHITCPPTSSSV